jgi:hypothetical protein
MEPQTKSLITKPGQYLYLSVIKLQSNIKTNFSRYVANENKFAGISTSSSDYSPKQLPVHYIHPARVYVKSDEKSEFQTTQATDYQAWKTEIPKRWKQDQTTTKGQYSVINIGHR